MMDYTCPKCGGEMASPDSMAGQSETCPSCGNVTVVPTSVAVTPSSPPSLQPSPAPPSPAVVLAVAPQPAVTTVNVNVPAATSVSGLGVAALVLGILALLTCWIPFVGVISMPFSGIGLVLGGIGLIVSLAGRKSGVGMPIAGSTICLIALIVALASTGAGVAAVDQVAQEAERSAERERATNQESAAPTATTRPAPATPRPAPGVTWSPATSPVRQGDVQIRVVSAVVGRVPLTDEIDDSEGRSKDPLLAIKLELKNLGQTRKVDYRSWMGADFAMDRDYATLKDNFDNGYKRITFGMTDTPTGHTKRDSLYPGKTLSDVLVFERPIGAVKYLNLEMPAKNFGGTGMIRLRVPASMLKEQ